MENRKQQTWECQVTVVLCCVSAVCSSHLDGRRGVQREEIYGKVFLPLKIVQPLRLKTRSNFLYPSAMCLLNVWTRINELSLFLDYSSDAPWLEGKKMSALNNERLAKIWNPGSVKPRTCNCKLQLLRFVFSHEKPNAKGLYQCCHVK